MKRLLALACLLPLVAWLAYALLAHPVALHLARHWGPQILQAGDGKFTDAAAFVQHRLYEGAWLLTWTLGLLALAVGAGTLWARRLPPLWKWIPYSMTGFIGLNLWIHLAATTCLFWCLFWNGKGATHNLTQFHIKRLLMEESPAPVKVVLAGSSQVRAQIDARQLNRQLGSNCFTTELHFPGSRGYDFLFLDRQLAGHQADVVVCYLSELNFFGGGVSDGFSLFFKFQDLPQFLRLGGQPQWSAQAFGYGLLGDVLPLFRLRDLGAQRLLGQELAGLGQQQQITSLSASLRQRALEAATLYRAGAQSDFSMAAFDAFVARCRARHRTVILCCGQLNPVLSRELQPALRPQMLAFLRQLAAKYDHVVLLDERELPPQTEADYEDLTHVNAAAQARFTRVIAQTLQNLRK